MGCCGDSYDRCIDVPQQYCRVRISTGPYFSGNERGTFVIAIVDSNKCKAGSLRQKTGVRSAKVAHA